MCHTAVHCRTFPHKWQLPGAAAGEHVLALATLRNTHPSHPVCPCCPFSTQEVPAGNILAIAGLDLAILKSATVASTPLCRPLAPMLFQVHWHFLCTIACLLRGPGACLACRGC